MFLFSPDFPQSNKLIFPTEVNHFVCLHITNDRKKKYAFYRLKIPIWVKTGKLGEFQKIYNRLDFEVCMGSFPKLSNTKLSKLILFG